MQTLDTLTATPAGALNSPAAERNASAIRQSLLPYLPARGRVLEIASGSGQHAAIMAAAASGIVWEPSDPNPDARRSTDLWARDSGLTNIAQALSVDMLEPATWPNNTYDAVVCINMIHISPWEATEGLMQLAGKVLPVGGLLYIYGPFTEDGTDLAPSNAAFDDSLRARNPQWGLRDLADVKTKAKIHGLRFTRRAEMPANNLSLLFRRF